MQRVRRQTDSEMGSSFETALFIQNSKTSIHYVGSIHLETSLVFSRLTQQIRRDYYFVIHLKGRKPSGAAAYLLRMQSKETK